MTDLDQTVANLIGSNRTLRPTRNEFCNALKFCNELVD
jgi:hypothetical protein